MVKISISLAASEMGKKGGRARYQKAGKKGMSELGKKGMLSRWGKKKNNG